MVRKEKKKEKKKKKKKKTKPHSENSQMLPSAQDQEPLPTPNPLPVVSQLQNVEGLCQATLAPIRKPSMKHERELLRKRNALQRSIIFSKLPAKSCLASCQISSPGLTNPLFTGLEPSGLADSAGQASSPAK